ncbi:MAG: hypothetical protein ACP5P9_08365 [Acidimicrobiales bacterium]
MDTNPVLVTLELLAASIWVGSLVCLAVVARTGRATLDGPAQVAFFRALGRRYAVVGTAALLVAIGVGLAMAWPPSTWSATIDAAVVLAGLLVLASVAGMAQARAMGTLRGRSMNAPADPVARAAVRRGRRVATALRLLMAADTLGVVILAAITISR